MTYSITVKTTDGAAIVSATSGQLPDGTFTISGHEDTTGAGISVQRRDARGRFRAGAAHGHLRSEVQELAEALAELEA